MMKFQRNPLWIYRPLGEEKQGLLIPLVANKADLSVVVQVNESAALVWENLEFARSEAELCESLRPHFESMQDLDPDWRAQIRACVEEMRGEGILSAASK